MNIPQELKYTRDHEWVRLEGDRAYVGITDFAQSELGEIVFVDVDCEGEEISAGEKFGDIEAVKTVAELLMPVTATVVGINEELADAPELVNSDPYGKGWIIALEGVSQADFDALLSADDYKALI